MEVDDAELLALAGGDDSSDEEITQAPTTLAKAVSPMPVGSSTQTNAKSPSGVTPNTTAKRGPGTKGMKKTRKDDSEEEGEA